MQEHAPLLPVLATVSDRKREAIAQAALTLFASDGYERTSVDVIVAEAEVSKRTVYSHSGTKRIYFFPSSVPPTRGCWPGSGRWWAGPHGIATRGAR